MTVEEVLDNFKDLVKELLNFKRDYKSTDKAELAQRSVQFENLLQKLEAEVRNHISIEHQLKIIIENTQHKVDELEKFKSEAHLKLLDSDDRHKIKIDKDRNLRALEIECGKLKSLLEDKVKECEKLKKDLDKVKVLYRTEKNNAGIKKILEDKALEINKVHAIKGKDEKNTVRPLSRKGKSIEDATRSTPSPFRVKKENESGLEPRPSTLKKPVFKSHFRSSSDQVYPMTSKKILL